MAVEVGSCSSFNFFSNLPDPGLSNVASVTAEAEDVAVGVDVVVAPFQRNNCRENPTYSVTMLLLPKRCFIPMQDMNRCDDDTTLLCMSQRLRTGAKLS